MNRKDWKGLKLFCPYTGILWKKYLNSLYKEIFRKSIHLCTAFIPFLLNLFYWPIIILLLLAAAGFSLSELLRLHGIKVPIVSFITEISARKRDDGKFVLGPVTLVLGIVAAGLLFDSPYRTIGILALAFGDGLASLCGKFFGIVHIPFTEGKTVAGSLACFTAILCSTYIVSKDPFASLVIATVGMLIEVLPLRDFDNLLIPVLLSFTAKLIL
ncbi:MAG: phosphatidate cytidylyltransferase [Treponema sp.]|nr:phosphatidate cytidylyltransferase [Treponema sp.]